MYIYIDIYINVYINVYIYIYERDYKPSLTMIVYNVTIRNFTMFHVLTD